ncbi:MAG TPA: hypothetical protein PLA10_05490, partial [Clostridiales bacterium]|nr:hypothetical protein [Clostridiales bacterium]
MPVVVDEENKVIYLYQEKVDEKTFKSFFKNADAKLELLGLVPATIVEGEGDEAKEIETELIATGSTLTILNEVGPLTAMCDTDEDETEETTEEP